MFQAYNLIPTLTAEENITLPMDIAGREADPAWFDPIVDTVGLRDRLEHRPTSSPAGSSSASPSRVRSSRARTSSSPTSPPGTSTRRAAPRSSAFMRDAVDDLGQTIVMVTHDPNAAGYSDRVVFLADGQIVDEMHEPTADACWTG